jgi:hypothetical protein
VEHGVLDSIVQELYFLILEFADFEVVAENDLYFASTVAGRNSPLVILIGSRMVL